eukprot:gene4287-6076_t
MVDLPVPTQQELTTNIDLTQFNLNPTIAETNEAASLSLPRRGQVNQDNFVDLVLAGRIKKYSIQIPQSMDVSNNGKRLRKVTISNKDYQHLLIEILGRSTDYPTPQRPELQLHIIVLKSLKVGEYFIRRHNFNADNNNDNNETKNKDQNGNDYNSDDDLSVHNEVNERHIRVLFDEAKMLYILSEQIEDLILIQLKLCNNDNMISYELKIYKATTQFGDNIMNVLNNSLQRIWKRFLRDFMMPLMLDLQRMYDADQRVNYPISIHDDTPDTNTINTSLESMNRKVANESIPVQQPTTTNAVSIANERRKNNNRLNNNRNNNNNKNIINQNADNKIKKNDNEQKSRKSTSPQKK